MDGSDESDEFTEPDVSGTVCTVPSCAETAGITNKRPRQKISRAAFQWKKAVFFSFPLPSILIQSNCTPFMDKWQEETAKKPTLFILNA